MATVNSIKIIADFFLLSLSWTLIFFSPIAPSSLTGAGLVKLLSNVALGSLVISIVMQIVSTMEVVNLIFALKIFALLALFLRSVFHGDGHEKKITMSFLYLFLICVLLFLLGTLVKFHFLSFVFLISASLFLGIVTYSMILGHWYLVVPHLSARPLMIAAVITWIILFLKISWSVHTLFSHYDFFKEQTTLGSGYAFNWMLLTMRVSFGYLVILGMSFFNWKLLKLRSIQSSTGVLYAMTFFVFIGELISTYIFFNYGLYI